MDLRDIAMPDAVGFWPPAPFACFLLVLIGCSLVLLILRWLARRRSEAYRREGLALAARIEEKFRNQESTAAGLEALGSLLKRVALAAFPRRQVAALSGEAWLRFLESTCPECSFTTGPGRLLADAAYDRSKAAEIRTEDGRQLLAQARNWIRNHHRPPSDRIP